MSSSSSPHHGHYYSPRHREGPSGGGNPYAAWTAAAPPPSHGGGGGYYYPTQAPTPAQPSRLLGATKTWFVRIVVLLVLAGIGVLYWRQSAIRARMRNFEAVVGALGQAVAEGGAPPGGPRVHYALTTHDEGQEVAAEPESTALEQAVGRVAGAMQSGRNRKSGRAVPGKSAHAKRSGVPPPPREVPEALVGQRQQQQEQEQQEQEEPSRYSQPTEAEGIEVFDMRGKSKGWRLFSDAK